VHGRSVDAPLFLPGGAAPTDGHGALTLGGLGGLGFGLGVRSGFGWWATGLGFGVLATGCGVGAGVGRAVAAGVGAGVGCAVGAGVGAGVGWAVGAGVGTRFGATEGALVTAGDGVTAVATVGVPAGVGETAGLGSIDGDGLATVGPTLAGGWDGVVPGGSDADPPGWEVEPVGGCGVAAGPPGGTTAIGPADAAARCWSSAPPMPSAIVARTRFKTPRPMMSRMRWRAVTAMWDSFGPGQCGSGCPDGTRRRTNPASPRVAQT